MSAPLAERELELLDAYWRAANYLSSAAMSTALGGIDAVVFTGGIGEHAAPVRDAIVEQLRFLGDFEMHVVEAREDVVAARAARTLA